MAKQGKKYRKAIEGLTPGQVIPVEKALASIKNLAFAKFDESVDIDVNLGIDPTKGDQVVRGSVVLPHAKAKQVRVLVFAKGDQADAATQAGADFVGLSDLVEKIKGGWLDFDFAVATPDVMAQIGQVAKILGPRGLLPNKKLGTVTFDVAPVIKDLKSGRLFFKNDKGGNVHFSIGAVSFDPKNLLENLVSFTKALAASKPAASKGKFLKKMTVTSTMGPGIQVNPDEIL